MELYGLLGEKLSHSLSPQINKLIFEECNLDAAYKLFEIPKDKLEQYVDAVKLLKIKGFNVTIPYKEKIIKHLDYISDAAKAIGAVNTVMVKDNKLYGFNSDYYGVGVMLNRKSISVNGKVAVVLGSGGACKAVTTYLLDNEISKVYIVTRSLENIKNMYEDSRVMFITYNDLKTISGDILINSTPVGMYPNVKNSPVDCEIIKNYKVLVDLIYNQTDTTFLTMGKELGKITVGGLYMLVGQAIRSQEIFNDIKIDKDVITDIYDVISLTFNEGQEG